MNTALELLRLALDRGWALGLLLLIFCGLVLLADQYGIALPVLVKEWAGAGALFGAATFLGFRRCARRAIYTKSVEDVALAS